MTELCALRNSVRVSLQGWRARGHRKKRGRGGARCGARDESQNAEAKARGAGELELLEGHGVAA